MLVLHLFLCARPSCFCGLYMFDRFTSVSFVLSDFTLFLRSYVLLVCSGFIPLLVSVVMSEFDTKRIYTYIYI